MAQNELLDGPSMTRALTRIAHEILNVIKESMNVF